MRHDFMFTSEAVTEGHPDKLCDQISDAAVDAFLRRDPRAMVRAECAIYKDVVFIAARFGADATVDFPHLARTVLSEAGYRGDPYDPARVSVLTTLQELPRPPRYEFDPAALQDEELDGLPAGEQVTLFGYACNQTPELMPLPIWLGRRLARRVSELRSQDGYGWLMPEARVQVGVEYRQRRPSRLHSVTLIVSQRQGGAPALHELRELLRAEVVDHCLAGLELAPDGRTRVLVNPEGALVDGGPVVHAGQTGRKNAVDTYGEYCRQSERALSGKDPLRIDRIGAYAARHAAASLVKSGLAEECEVTLSYAVGVARPISIGVESFGTGRMDDAALAGLLEARCEFRPAGIIRDFRLRDLPAAHPQGFYRWLAARGHVGRSDLRLPWEEAAEDLG